MASDDAARLTREQDATTIEPEQRQHSRLGAESPLHQADIEKDRRNAGK